MAILAPATPSHQPDLARPVCGRLPPPTGQLRATRRLAQQPTRYHTPLAVPTGSAPRLGFAVRVVGQPALRLPPQPRHADAHQLQMGLLALRDILGYLVQQQIYFYRLGDSLLPLHDPALAWQQLDDCTAELALIGAQVQQQQVRLSLHAHHGVALGSSDPAVVTHSQQELALLAHLLAYLHPAPEGCIVVHVGGSRSECHTTLARFVRHYQQLPLAVQQRVVVEHDTSGFDLADLLWLHQQCGVAVIFDYLHWQLQPHQQLPLAVALGLALATWPVGVRPEVHLSSARTEAHLLPARGGQVAQVLPPRLGQHADFIAAGDLLRLLAAGRGLPHFDIMIEAKAGDLAVLRLRHEIARLAPQHRLA